MFEAKYVDYMVTEKQGMKITRPNGSDDYIFIYFPHPMHFWLNGEEFIERYRSLTNVLLDDENMFGFYYTQLYDIEQEINGLYTYDRVPKFDMKIFK